MSDISSPPVRWRLLRRGWPWLVGILILVFVITRVPFAAFRDALGRGPHVELAAVNLAIYVVVLGTDTVSTWVGLIAMKMRRPLGKVLIVRGATYALFVINYAVGQGGFGYYLHRSGTPALRAVGATLFLIGTNLAGLILVTLVAFACCGHRVDSPAMWWTLVVGSIGFGVYLVVIAMSPGALARREVLVPLFDAGVRGHMLAVVARIPHVFVTVLGQWAAIVVWGIDVPLAAGLTIMPAVVIASVLPISVAGLGTTQAALVVFFSSYAPGATEDDRAAGILAFAIVHFVYGVVASLAVGLASLPFARRAGVLVPRPDRQ